MLVWVVGCFTNILRVRNKKGVRDESEENTGNNRLFDVRGWCYDVWDSNNRYSPNTIYECPGMERGFSSSY